ncbi:MAG TPA: hypothetical protein VF040_01850 [Ktedonobacterales bacterium]
MRMRLRENHSRLRTARRWLLRIAIGSFIAGWLSILVLAAPLVAYGDSPTTMDSYGATASGWAIQPFIVNDEFINIPAADESTPYVFVSIDSGPTSDAKAAYFYPGSAINTVLNNENAGVQIPNGVEATYPGNGSASSQAAPLSDGVASQGGAAQEATQASPGYAQATAGIASYQFAPGTSLPSVPGGGGVPSVPTVAPPPLPSPPGGSAPTPPPAPTAVPPTPTPRVCVGPICLSQTIPNATGAGHTQVAALTPPGTQLPDVFQQRLITALRAAEVANPGLLKLGGGHLAAADPNLPYAAADESGQATAQATNDGVTAIVAVRAAHVELFQGLITFATVDSTLRGQAPASGDQGTGTVTTTVTGATIAGIPVTIDQNGVQVSNQGGSASQSAIQQLSSALNTALKAAGIQIALTSTNSMQDAGKWQGSGGGVQVTGELAPGNGVPATHINFSIGQITGSVYAVPATPSSSSDGGSFCLFCFGSRHSSGGGGSGSGGSGGSGSGSDGTGGNGSGGSGSGGSGNTPGHSARGGIASVVGSLNAGQMLAVLFVVQGCSTAAVAAAANAAETAARAGAIMPEEETH